jgi:hypothetical protein
MRSETEPESGVSEKTSPGEVFPELGVGIVAVGRNSPVLEILSGWGSGEDLTSLGIFIDLQQHELTGLIEILHLIDEREVIGVHVVKSIDGRLIGDRVLGLIITSIENTSDLARCDTCVVILEILQVEGNPATVYQDATLLALLIQVSEERCDNLDALLVVAHLLYLNLLGMIKDSSDLYLLERVITLELVEILARLAPNEPSCIPGCDIDSSLSEKRCPINNKNLGINQLIITLEDSI